MRAAGLEVLPYHDNVPSFGEWGWWIAAKKDRYKTATLMKKISTIKEFNVETEYLTPQVTKSNLVFGKEQLNTKEIGFNTIANSLVYAYYLQSWQE